jgi:hypothetical protein
MEPTTDTDMDEFLAEHSVNYVPPGTAVSLPRRQAAKGTAVAAAVSLPMSALCSNLPKADNGNYIWIQTLYSALNNKGRAGFVMANSAADAGATELGIRKKLIEEKAVDVIVADHVRGGPARAAASPYSQGGLPTVPPPPVGREALLVVRPRCERDPGERPADADRIVHTVAKPVCQPRNCRPPLGRLRTSSNGK